MIQQRRKNSDFTLIEENLSEDSRHFISRASEPGIEECGGERWTEEKFVKIRRCSQRERRRK